MKTIEHTMPRLRQKWLDAATQPWPHRRNPAVRQPGVMTPRQLRAEVLALIG
ncbi:MAG TPA: hypothetical protein VFP14_12120 [Novosphingobium sp.]|nr:hypothetical protein [Novosphingobium sp.]